jgi:ArsR family transcriptional regulator
MKALLLVECCAPLAGADLSDAEAAQLERLFKALADRNRLRILNCLLQAGGEPVCVCEFQPTLGIAQPTVSHHLKQLVDAGLLEREKRGTFAYYRLRPGALDQIGGVLAEASSTSSALRREPARAAASRTGGRGRPRSRLRP